MKATFFVSLILSLGVAATPAVDTTTIEDGGYTYTGIDKSTISVSGKANSMSSSPSLPSVASKPDATASPATLPMLTASPESASALETTAAGLAAVDVCSASPAPALDSAGPKL
ncbi:unnamed protein product [Fusarium equiseti]|uniref:Uncharacterized protein n=1 Tax=Fusarium equiseti TaxID=61235 RepID=A0A8J2IKH4_FUSEQ|nr:unnamed protein product [Fusarium equiseti]